MHENDMPEKKKRRKKIIFTAAVKVSRFGTAGAAFENLTGRYKSRVQTRAQRLRVDTVFIKFENEN